MSAMIRRVVLTCVLSLAPSIASAQQPVDQADVYFRQGNILYKAQSFAEAREAFASAWKLKKAHDIAANLAYTEMRLGRFREAAEHLAFAVKTWPPTGKADKRDYAIERFETAKREVGTLTVHVSETKADILVDGQFAGTSPLDTDIFVDPGSHTVEAKLIYFADAKQAVNVAKGSPATVNLMLAPALRPSPAPSSPTVVVAPPATLPSPSSRVSPALFVVGGSLAALGLAIGGGLTLVANGKGADAKTLRADLGSRSACAGSTVDTPSCTALKGDLASKDSFTKAAFASFIVGGAFALATTSLGAWAGIAPTREGRAQSVRVVPILGRNEGGAAVFGNF